MSAGNSSYNGLQVPANKHVSRGLTVLLNYTWSKLIDDASDDGTQPFNPFNPGANRSVSDNDVPHRFVGSFVWQVPGVAQHGGLLRVVTGGWETNGIVTLQSGSPFSVFSVVDNSQSAVNADHADHIA